MKCVYITLWETQSLCLCVNEHMHNNSYSCITACVLVLEMYKGAGRVPQAIKSIFQELL